MKQDLLDPPLTPQRFQALAKASGLEPLVLAYHERGWKISLLLPTSPWVFDGAFVRVEEKTVWLSPIFLNEGKWPELPLFTTVLLHELGHCEAYERGLDYKDEGIAWEIAEEISPVPLPAEWDEIRREGMESYERAPVGFGGPG